MGSHIGFLFLILTFNGICIIISHLYSVSSALQSLFLGTIAVLVSSITKYPSIAEITSATYYHSRSALWLAHRLLTFEANPRHRALQDAYAGCSLVCVPAAPYQQKQSQPTGVGVRAAQGVPSNQADPRLVAMPVETTNQQASPRPLQISAAHQTTPRYGSVRRSPGPRIWVARARAPGPRRSDC
jgi:hypothetical protein